MRRFFVFAVSILAVMSAHSVYQSHVSPVWGYLGYEYYFPDSRTLLMCWAFALIPVIILPISFSRPSDVAVWLLYSLVYVSSVTVPTYRGLLQYNEALRSNAGLLVSILIVVACTRVRPKSLTNLRVSPGLFWILLIAMSIVSYGFIFGTFGLSFSIPNLSNLYDVRLEYREEVYTSSPFVAYAILWQSIVVNNLVIAKGFVSRWKILIFIGFVGQLAIFSLTGFKTVFLSTLMLGAVALVTATPRSRNLFGIWVLAASALIPFAMVALDAFFGTISFTSNIFMRMFLTPGSLTGSYIDFFSQYPKAMYAHSFLSAFFDYPYSMNYNFVLGEYFFGNAEVSLNANLWADGYANFGYLGMYISSLVLGVVLWVLDSSVSKGNTRAVAMVLGVVVFTIANVSVFTGLLSNGLGLLLLFTVVMPEGWASRSSEADQADERESRGALEGNPTPLPHKAAL